jgi:hypothetical protein
MQVMYLQTFKIAGIVAGKRWHNCRHKILLATLLAFRW